MKYNNLPSERPASNSDATLKVFNTFYDVPLELNNSELIAMTGFFEERGFDPLAAESTAITILTQAKKDNYSGMQILDTLSGMDNVTISGLVAEILNYNRFKTSSIGVVQLSSPSAEVSRNIETMEGFRSTMGFVDHVNSTLPSRPRPLGPPTYAIVPNVTSALEGDTITFTVTTTNVGTASIPWIMYAGQYPFYNQISSNDFTNNSYNGGVVNVVNNTGSIIITIAADTLTEGTESFGVMLLSSSNQTLATSASVLVADNSITPLSLFTDTFAEPFRSIDTHIANTLQSWLFGTTTYLANAVTTNSGNAIVDMHLDLNVTDGNTTIYPDFIPSSPDYYAEIEVREFGWINSDNVDFSSYIDLWIRGTVININDATLTQGLSLTIYKGIVNGVTTYRLEVYSNDGVNYNQIYTTDVHVEMDYSNKFAIGAVGDNVFVYYNGRLLTTLVGEAAPYTTAGNVIIDAFSVNPGVFQLVIPTLTVNTTPPIIPFFLDLLPTSNINSDVISGTAPLTVNFTGSVTWPTNNQIVGSDVYTFYFGDNTKSTVSYPTSTVSHTYNTPGTYIATLRTAITVTSPDVNYTGYTNNYPTVTITVT